jgi:hypothetical protein
MIFLSLVILAGSGASAAYWYATMPTEQPIHINYDGIRDHVQSLSLTDSMKEWSELRQGISKGELPPMQMYLDMRETHWRWTYISLGGCALGVVLCVIGLTTGKKADRPRRQST